MAVPPRVQFEPWTLDRPIVVRLVLLVSIHELCDVSQCNGRASGREPHQHLFVCEWSRWTYDDLKRQQMSFLLVNLITSLNVLLERLTNTIKAMRLKIRNVQANGEGKWNPSGGRFTSLLSVMNHEMVRVAYLICFIVLSAHASPPASPKDAVKPQRVRVNTVAEPMTPSASAAPGLTGAHVVNDAAAKAARQDQDPHLNGAVTDIR